MKVVLGGIEMSTGVPDENGALWYVTEWDGWDSPGLRQSFLDPSGQHGQVVTEALLSSRSVTLTGVCKAPSEAAFWASYNRLLAATAGLGVEFDLVVSEDVDKRLGVVRGGPVRNKIVGLGSFEWEVSLIAPDPLKYAVAEKSFPVSAGGSLDLVNAGTFTTFPIITAVGAVSVENFTSGLTMTTGSNTVPPYTQFDTRRRTVYSGTINNYGKIAPNNVWWGLLPGTNEIRNHGASAVDVTYHDAWL